VLLIAVLSLMAYRSSYQARQNQSLWVKPLNVSPSPQSALPKFREIMGSFGKNQTVTQVLLEQGLPLPLIHQIVDSTRPVYDLAKVKAEQLYWLCFTPDGKFSNFRYPVDDERYLTVYHDRAKDSLVPVMKSFAYETRVETVSAIIDSSLFASVIGIGEKDQLALDLAEIFGSDIDFHTDIQKGDSFRVLIERKYLDDQFSKNGLILAASFTNEGKEFIGIRYEDEHGKPAYYAPDGKALKKSFLKSPLKFGRITSKFTHARFHPVLKIVRPHLGVDYAAPIGTPVQSVAAGVVTGAGYGGGGGKMVTVRHDNGYLTKYLHLSRMAIKSGARVDQGDVIGYVGSTGLSTGPHLDFRIFKNNKAVNPLKVISPPGLPISRARFDDFAALRDKRIDELRLTKDDSRLARR
jgi:murein DD-endopeptidase MepM/ murein hydrolase activator NlpD